MDSISERKSSSYDLIESYKTPLFIEGRIESYSDDVPEIIMLKKPNMQNDKNISSKNSQNTQKLQNNVFLYSKGLKMDNGGFPRKENFNHFHRSLKNRDLVSMRKTILREGEKLVFPTYCSINIEGFENCVSKYKNYKIDNNTEKDMIKLYSMSLARDVPFSEYNRNSTIIEICKILNNSTEKIVKPSNIFGIPHNSYISQFLLQDKVYSYVENTDFIKNWEEIFGSDIQESYREYPKYITTGRDLAFVYNNLDINKYYGIIENILQKMGINYNQEYKDYLSQYHIDEPQFKFSNLIEKINKKCEKIVYYMKWNNPIICPENYSIEIERVRKEQGYNPNKFTQYLLYNPILKKVKSLQGNYLLSQASSKGCELSPPSPCFKTVLSSAFNTLLKVFYDLEKEMNVLIVTNGELFETAKVTTVSEELNKLVRNISLAGCWSGSSFKENEYDIKLGEKIALCIIEKEIENIKKSGYSFAIKLHLCDQKMIYIK